MAQTNNEIIINRPLDFVFNFMSRRMDDYLVRLDPNLLIVEQISEGEVRKGAQFRLISSKSASERDPTKTDLIKGLDLGALEPDLRKEIKEAYIEVTAFERNKLLEFIRVDENNLKVLEKYTFRAAEGATVLAYSPEYTLSEIKKGIKIELAGKSNLKNFALKLLFKPLIKFSLKMHLKSLKTMIEAEPEV